MSDETEALAEPGEPTGDIALIGEDGAAAHRISMGALQALYNQVTGKTEELSKHFFKPFQVRLADLEQLNHKLTQVCEQYNIQSSNVTISVFHLNDVKEQFSSFERFRFYNQSATAPVESVLLKYNFLILLPKKHLAQNYTLSVRVSSPITAHRRMEDEIEAGRFPRSVVRFFYGSTAVVTVGYVDYMVARNLLHLTEEWFEGLDFAQVGWPLRQLRKRSDLARPLAEYGLLLTSFAAVWKLLPGLLVAATLSASYVQLEVASLVFLFISYRFGSFLGSAVEAGLEMWQPLGYLNLNRGDEKEIDSARKRNRQNLLRAAGGGLVTLLLGVLASVLANTISR